MQCFLQTCYKKKLETSFVSFKTKRYLHSIAAHQRYKKIKILTIKKRNYITVSFHIKLKRRSYCHTRAQKRKKKQKKTVCLIFLKTYCFHLCSFKIKRCLYCRSSERTKLNCRSEIFVLILVCLKRSYKTLRIPF